MLTFPRKTHSPENTLYVWREVGETWVMFVVSNV